MKKTYLSLLTATVLGLAITGVAVAGKTDCALKHQKHHKMHMQKRPHGMHMPPPMQPFYLNHITLTAEQEDKVFALTHAEIPKARAHKKEQHALRNTLMTLIQKNEYSEKEARKIADRLAEIEREKVLSRAALDNKVFNLLTDEQKKQINLKAHPLKHNEKPPAPMPHASALDKGSKSRFYHA